uniref:Uncharacterized protein n=1 Tax=Romanomermis culicivorax TaxID=13658 RepID=A0A915K9K2_ROMCU
MPLFVVEVLYSFESTNDRGYSVIVHPAEKYVLLCDKDPEWWYVARDAESSDGGFYIPRTYVRLLPQIEFSNRQNVITFRRPAANRMSHVEILSKSYSIDPNGSGNSTNYRHASKNFGFKLADPERLSRSIPYDLNFIHNINSLTNECIHLNNVDRRDAIQSPVNEESSPDGKLNASQIMRSKSTKEHTDGPIYANLLYSDRSNCKPPSSPDGDNHLIKNLQGGWQMYEDCSSGRVFFYHPIAKTSTWKPPRILTSLYRQDDLGWHSTVLEDSDASFTAAECEKDKEQDDPITANAALMVSTSEIIRESFSENCERINNSASDSNKAIENQELLNGHSDDLQKEENEMHSQELESKIISCVQKNCDWPPPPPLPIRETLTESSTSRQKSSIEVAGQPENGQECNEKFASGSTTYNTMGALACLEESLKASSCRTSTQALVTLKLVGFRIFVFVTGMSQAPVPWYLASASA